MNDERQFSEESPVQTSKGDFHKNPGMMEERSTFESEEFTLEEESKQQLQSELRKKRSLSDVADDSVNLPPEESKEEDLSPEEAQRRTDELIQKMLQEDAAGEEDDLDEQDE